MEANEQELQEKSKQTKFCGELQRLKWLEKKHRSPSLQLIIHLDFITNSVAKTLSDDIVVPFDLNAKYNEIATKLSSTYIKSCHHVI